MSKLYLLISLSIMAMSLSTICEDGSACRGAQTCCKVDFGYGCCPYENATCCSDQVHCCPNGYTCEEGDCKRDTSNAFLTYLFESTEFGTINKQDEELKGVPSIKDLLKCISDIKPVAYDVKEIIELWTKGDADSKKKILEILPRIATEGIAMGTDCYKVIQEILS